VLILDGRIIFSYDEAYDEHLGYEVIEMICVRVFAIIDVEDPASSFTGSRSGSF